ncbi:MAG: Isonitrile hydratase [Pseudomonadota bacterium]
MMNRRDFGRLLTGLGALQGLVFAQKAQAAKPGQTAANRPAVVGDRAQATIDDLNTFMGGELVRVGIVLYPGVYAMDVVNLVSVFQSLGGAIVHLISRDKEVVTNEPADPVSLVPLTPTETYADAPKELDVLVLPGTLPGKYGLLEDQALMAYLAEAAKHAKLVAGVGTGSLIMAAAGLLRGRKATTFWPFKPMLKQMGVNVVDKRVVVDGNRVTAAGSTASMELGLQLVELVRNKSQAQLVQLYLEFDPAAPKGGSPEKAPADVSRFMNMMYKETLKDGMDAADRVAARLKAPK